MYIMVLTRQHTISSLHAMSLGILIFVHKIIAQPNDDWIAMEQLAEEYPFVVALLNEHQQFLCTGTIIHSQAVLTSGECVNEGPFFVAVAATVISPSTTLNLLEVTYTVLHEDYLYYFNPRTPNATKIMNNIGLVIVKSHPLDKFVEPADCLDLKLEDEILSMIGFVSSQSSKVLLMESEYQELPCHHTQSYYVFCGKQPGLKQAFAKGGPVLFQSKVVGVLAAPSGAVITPHGDKLTVFTFTAPYLTWIISNLYDNLDSEVLASQQYLYDIENGFSETCALTKCNIILSCIMNLLNHF